jgi:DAK2 domain fusion protein YloV
MDDSNQAPETVVEALKASQLREVVQHYGEALRAHRKGLDKLNVYPVPDGDTGTNMSLTVQSVVAELKSAGGSDMRTISSAISKGAIMGARGNSGAILAQVLRGVAESAKEKTSLSPSDVADALEKAKKGAYESVLKPVEGTILTVVSAAATAARQSADKGTKLKEQMDHVRHASAEALARTPELLPVLKQAGVVDAGGSGFLLFVDALRYVVSGEPIPAAAEFDDDDVTADVAALEHTELSELRYEVMFLLEGDDAGIPTFRSAWGDVGDSIVVVGGDGLFNCHIHSDDIGASIEVALNYGRPSQIRITDLLEQAAAHDEEMFGEHQPSVETAVVAVVNGAGIGDIYRSMGVQRLVVGGQSMNPSVSDLLSAVEAAPSQSVVLLPNNKNIHAAAQQVNELSAKNVFVLPTKSVVEGMSALLGYDETKSGDKNASAMQEASAHVVCGEVTQAVRDTSDDVRPIKQGDWLGVSPDGITVVAATLSEALRELTETLVGDDHEVLTLVEGEGATPEATAALLEWLSSARPHVEYQVHQGGQPLYPYLLGVE